MAAAATPRAKRADAIRNRERVIAAAASVLAELGPEASVDDVAARAGVGRATVYRCFPTKEHLVAGVAAERLRRFEQLATDALEEEDAGAAFRQVCDDRGDTAEGPDHAGWLQLRSGVPAVAKARQDARAALGLSSCRRQERTGRAGPEATQR